MIRGLALAAIQVAIVLSIGGKLELDRASLPTVWARAEPLDPDLPVRGRYVSLTIDVEPRGFGSVLYSAASLSIEDGKLIARPADGGSVMVSLIGPIAQLSRPVAFFIPEHVPDPSQRRAGEEVWVELSVPDHGPPRPIRLGVRKNGVLTPLE